MMKRTVYGLLVVLIVLMGSSIRAAQPPLPTPPTPPTPNFWGMVVRDPVYEWGTHPNFPNQANQPFIDSMLDTLQAMGAEWVRFEFHGVWDDTDYGAINLAQADYFVQAARKRGLKVLALIGTDILRGPQAQVRRFDGGTMSGTIPITNPDRELSPCPGLPIGCGVNAYQKAWLERALLIADHYRGQVDAYEIFNEQNHYFALLNETANTQDEMNPHYVAQTITKFFRILRSQTLPDPTPIIVGGLHPLRSIESRRTDTQYIEALYTSAPFTGYQSANGRWPLDGIGSHPYPAEIRRPSSDNDFLYRVGPRLDALVATIRAYDASARLWITEVGTRGNPNDPADLNRQANFLGQIAAIIHSRRANVGPWFWFKYEDFPPDSESWGVVRIPYDVNGRYDVNGTVELFKPAATTYQSMVFNFRERVWLPLISR